MQQNLNKFNTFFVPGTLYKVQLDIQFYNIVTLNKLHYTNPIIACLLQIIEGYNTLFLYKMIFIINKQKYYCKLFPYEVDIIFDYFEKLEYKN